MWTIRSEPLPGQNGLKSVVNSDTGPASVAEVLAALHDDGGFRKQFNSHLAAMPLRGFRWETPRATSETVANPFECVVLDDPRLCCPSDPTPFNSHFQHAKGKDVLAFPNLSGDAIMVVPCPLSPTSDYGHLATFVRTAPESQCHSLWKLVAQSMLARIGVKPVWLSTAGAGVPWLHVRLDDRPKYYHHGPYRADFHSEQERKP